MFTTARQQIAQARTARVQRAVLDALGLPLLLFVIIIGFFWKITLTHQFSWLESPDMANQVLPWQQVQAAAFHQGKFPAWDPYLWAGQSLIGQAQPGTAYPLNWILYSLPLTDRHIRTFWFNWYFALLHFLAALFCYWLCRDLELTRLASLIAGTAFGIAGAIGTTDWPQMLNGAIWIPLVLLFLLRATRESPLLNAGLSGFFLGISWLSGHHQIPIFITLAMAGVWVFYIFRGNKLHWNVLGLAAVFALFLALTSALQVLPAYEYGHWARRWVGAPSPLEWRDIVPYTIHREHSLGATTIFGLLIPGLHKEVDPYIGLVILSLAVLGIAFRWSEVSVRILSVLALAGLFLSLGYQDVFQGFLYAVLPIFEKARTPAMAVVLFNFGVAVLAAYGFDGLRIERASVWPRRVGLWLASGAVVMLSLMLGGMMTKQLAFDYDDRIVLVAVTGLLVGVLYIAYDKRNLGITAVGVAGLLLLLAEMGNSTGYAYVHRLEKNRAIYLNKFSENADLLAWLKRQPGPFRIQINSHDIPFNYGDWYAIEVFGGYTASLPSHLMRLGWDGERTRMLYGTRYWIASGPRGPDQVHVFTAQSGLKAYYVASAFPRVWTIHQAAVLASESQIRPAIENSGFDLRHTAFFLGEAPKLSPCASEDQVAELQSDLDAVVIQADMQCSGMVVLSDNYYPGWIAAVDGQPARIWEAYTAIRGVEVKRGTHRIEMHYRPWTVRVGAVMLAMSVAALFALGWMERCMSRRVLR